MATHTYRVYIHRVKVTVTSGAHAGVYIWNNIESRTNDANEAINYVKEQIKHRIAVYGQEADYTIEYIELATYTDISR